MSSLEIRFTLKERQQRCIVVMVAAAARSIHAPKLARALSGTCISFKQPSLLECQPFLDMGVP